MRARLTISIDAGLHEELAASVPPGSMSAFFERAARAHLESLRRAALVDAAAEADPDDDLDELAALSPRPRAGAELPWTSLRPPGARQ